MTIAAKPLSASIIIIFFGAIALGQVTGYWKTESGKVPATYEEGEFAGEVNPADIRGSYTFGDVEAAFGVPAELLGAAFGISDPETFAIKGLEEIYGEVDGMEVGTDAVRLFVARYIGRPYEPEETTALPVSAIPLLSPEAQTELADRAVSLEASTLGGSAGSDLMEGTVPEIAAEEERLVKGMTTIAELLTWGIEEDEIAFVFGGALPTPTSLSLRSAAEAADVEFSTVKEELQALVDSR